MNDDRKEEIDDKNDHHFVINTYNEYNILKEEKFLPVCGMMSLFFIYQKLNDNLMAKWQGTLYPLHFYFIIHLIKSFISIVKSEKDEDDDIVIKRIIHIDSISSILLISNFFKLIQNALVICGIYYFGEFMDTRKDENLYISIYVIFTLCVFRLIYSFLRKFRLFSMVRNTQQEEQGSHLAFFTSLTTPILTYLSNMMVVCSGSSGMCTQIYMSTLTSLLGAFGVTISDLSDYLFPLTIVLLGISLFSLYIKKRQLTHKPFLLGVFSCVLIIISHIFDDTFISYFIYPGNILMIGAAIWNARMNKFSGLPRFNK